MFSRDQKLSKLLLALEMQEQNKDMGVPQSLGAGGLSVPGGGTPRASRKPELQVLPWELRQECIADAVLEPLLLPHGAWAWASLHPFFFLLFLNCFSFFKIFIYYRERERERRCMRVGVQREGESLKSRHPAEPGAQSQGPEIVT